MESYSFSEKLRESVVAAPPRKSKFAMAYFFSMGVGSLLAWNTILTAVDFFQVRFPSYNISFLFPIPYIIGTILVNLFIVEIAHCVRLNARVVGGIAMMCVIMATMPLSSSNLPEHIGFWVLMISLFVLAAANIVSEASLIGMTALFPAVYIRFFQTGLGAAGLAVNALRMICLATVGDSSSDYISIIVYFGLTLLVTIHCIVIHLRFIRTDTFKFYTHKIHHDRHNDSSVQVEPNAPELAGALVSNQETVEEKITQRPPKATIALVLKEVYGSAILMVVIFIQTFMMFPGVTLKKNLSNMNSAWNTVILITTYNLFDITGKSMAGFKRKTMKKFLPLVVLLRFSLYAPFILVALKEKGWVEEDWVSLTVLALFGLTNGYCSSSLYVIAPEQVENHKKETVGFIIQLSLYIGIALGTFLALPLSNLGKDN